MLLEAEGTDGSRSDRRPLLGVEADQGKPLRLVERLDDREDDRSDDEEVDDGSEELSEVDLRARDDEPADLADVATGDELDEWVDDVFRERGDDGSERAADDDADGHVHDVAATDELLELFDELLHGCPPERCSCEHLASSITSQGTGSYHAFIARQTIGVHAVWRQRNRCTTGSIEFET